MPKVAIIHPDLGIGGAERLIVDTAIAIKSDDTLETEIWTSHYDKKHCFKDTEELTIKVKGNWIPRHILGFGHIIFSLFSNLYLTICCALFSKADLFIVDQISAWIPILRLLKPKSKIIFYCHFPDLRLANRNSLLRRIYRIPFDYLEVKGIKKAHLVLVNSLFTSGVVQSEFGELPLAVLYPCVNTNKNHLRKKTDFPFFVSINRYERKKDHSLAIRAIEEFTKKYDNVQLIIAGGYDERVIENVQHYKELDELIKSFNLESTVKLEKNLTEEQKWNYIGKATAVLYTPQNEHFGIVPIESLSVGTPVIACNSGGPLETVNIEGCYLCDPTSESFSNAMIQSFENEYNIDLLKKHAKKFGFDSFKNEWISHIKKLLNY